MNRHPLRMQIVNEVHTRPYFPRTAPVAVTHISVCCAQPFNPQISAHVLAFAVTLGLDTEQQKSGFLFAQNAQWALRFEPHTEFYTLTLFHLGALSAPNFPDPFIADLPGELLCGTQLILAPQGEALPVSGNEKKQITGARVQDGAAELRTDFQPKTGRRFTRFVLTDISLDPFDAGRLLQYLCEIESYRHAALLSLPLARTLMPQLTALDLKLADIAQRVGRDQPAALLTELMALAAEVEALSARTANRFAASQAYFTLVDRRIDQLRETRLPGLLSVRLFMDRHLLPARDTCQAAGARIDHLSRRIARSTGLVRAQVELSIEQQNRDQLAGLNKRSKQQLALQTKVESLTVIVVTYYAFDLIDRSVHNTLADPDIAKSIMFYVSFSVPFFAVGLYGILKFLRRSFDKD